MRVVPPHPAGAVAQRCARLTAALPAELETAGSRRVLPASPLTHVWGDPPIVLRCGVPKPPAYQRSTSSTTSVDGVPWFQQIGSGVVDWTAVRGRMFVQLRVPTSYDAQGSFLVDLAPAVKSATG